MSRLSDFLKKAISNKAILFLFSVIVFLIFYLFYQKDNMKQQMDLKIQFIELSALNFSIDALGGIDPK